MMRPRIRAALLCGVLCTATTPLNGQANAPVVTFAPAAWQVGAGGGTLTVAVTVTPPGSTWTAASGADWLTVNPSSGTGDGTIQVTAGPQTSGLPRVSGLAIGSQVFSVAQAGASGTFGVSPSSWTGPSSGGSHVVSVTAEPHDASWTVSSAEPWITGAPRGPYHVGSVVGGSTLKDGPSPLASFSFLEATAVAADGTIFVADTWNHRIRKIDPVTGAVTTLSGGGLTGAYAAFAADNFADGMASQARFREPASLAIGSDGMLYVADRGNWRIRRVNPSTGQVTTVAGSTSGVQDGEGEAARFIGPRGITAAPDGMLYVTDGAVLVRRVDPATQQVTTIAGSASGSQDGTGPFARFNDLGGLSMAPDGMLYVADRGNHRIRRVNPTTGEVTTVAGGVQGVVDAIGTAARFSYPTDVAVAADGTLFIVEIGWPRVDHFGHPLPTHGGPRIRRLNPTTAAVTTLAGTGEHGYVDDVGTAARFNEPLGITVAPSGALIVADSRNHRLRRVDPATARVTTLAGHDIVFADGSGTSTSFDSPYGIASAPDGSLYVTTIWDHRIRRVDPQTGAVTHVAGGGGSTNGAFADGIGAAARFAAPHGVAVAADGTIYVADTLNHRIRRIDPTTHAVTTVAGTTAGYADGAGASARFDSPRGIAVSADGQLFVADTGNNRIRRVHPATGIVSTLGTYTAPVGVAVADDGVLYAILQSQVARIDLNLGWVTPIATFGGLSGIAAAPDGTLFVTDSLSRRLIHIDPVSSAATVILQSAEGFLDGPAASARFSHLYGVAVTPGGRVYVAETTFLTRRGAAGYGRIRHIAGASARLRTAPNPSPDPRVGVATVAGQPVTVIQAGTGSVTPLSWEAPFDGGTQAVVVTTGHLEDTAWSAVSSAAWLTVLPEAGMGNGKILLAAAPRDGLSALSRTATVTVFGQTVSVTQPGVTPSYTLSAQTWQAPPADALRTVQLTAAPSDAPWTAVSSASWLTVAPAQGSGSATLHVSAQRHLDWSPRTATITLGGQTLVVTQAGPRPIMPGSHLNITLADATSSEWLAFHVSDNRSFCIRLTPTAGSTIAGAPRLLLRRAIGPFSLSLPQQGPFGGQRVCAIENFFATMLVTIDQLDPEPRAYRVDVVETTLWSNWFFIGGSYSSYTLLRNTTGSAVNVRVVWYRDTGSVAGIRLASIPPYGVVYWDARLTTSSAMQGSVQVAHDGEPHAIVGSQTTMSAETGLSFDTIFRQRRAW